MIQIWTCAILKCGMNEICNEIYNECECAPTFELRFEFFFFKGLPIRLKVKKLKGAQKLILGTVSARQLAPHCHVASTKSVLTTMTQHVHVRKDIIE